LWVSLFHVWNKSNFYHLFLHPEVYLIILLLLMLQAWNLSKQSQSTKRVFQLYGCVVTSRDMVSHKDPTRHFGKVTHFSWTISRFVVSAWNFSVIKTLSHSTDVLDHILTFQYYHVGIVFSHYTGHVLKIFMPIWPFPFLHFLINLFLSQLHLHFTDFFL